MKRYFLVYLLAILLVGCRDENVDITTISYVKVTPYSSSADISIYVANQNGNQSAATITQYGVYLSNVNKNPTEKDKTYTIKQGDSQFSYKNQKCSFKIQGLANNTTYYIRPFIGNKYGVVTGKVSTFTTEGSVNVITRAATDIDKFSATLNGEIQKLGSNVNLQEKGFFLSPTSTPSMNSYMRQIKITNTNYGSFSAKIQELKDNTHYYFRAYAKVDDEILYGDVFDFTTKKVQNEINLSLNNVTDITISSAKASGSVTIGEDAVGQLSKVGIICSRNSNPTIGNYNHKIVYDNSDLATWVGKHTISGNFTYMSYNTQYYYRMFYVKGYDYYYDADIRTFHTPVLNVSQALDIYNSLNLANGSTSANTYTIRGYVTQWNNGYPDYPNGDFWIDDTANGSTSRLRCFRIVGATEEDMHTLKVGDYVEVQDCNFMNYNGVPELQNGQYTIISQ